MELFISFNSVYSWTSLIYFLQKNLFCAINENHISTYSVGELTLRRIGLCNEFLGLGILISIGLNQAFATDQAAIPSKIEPILPITEKEDQSQRAAWMIESAQVARDYVEGVDRGHYIQSWTKGDSLFQHAISQKEWVQTLTSRQNRLGKLKARQLKNQRFAKDPHNLPKGAYMVVEYATSFENAPYSNELLTLRRGTDGKWRVLTYQIN